MPQAKSSLEKITETGIAPVQKVIDKFLESADVSAVYGAPIQHGETLIIPTAEVLSGLGFGLGTGGGEGPQEEGKETSLGGGGGGGGGGRVFSRPVAVIIADQNGVRVEPVVDPTKIALALFTTLGFMAAVAGRMRRPKLKLEG